MDVEKMVKKQYPLRLDPKLYDSLERWAADELRSVNAHIEFLLREAVRHVGRLSEQVSHDDSDETIH
jgi:hypothetical protein